MAFVQGAGKSSGASPASFAAFGSSVAVGDLIVVNCGGDGGITGAVTGVTDSLGNTYIQVPAFDLANGAGTLNMDAWYTVVTHAGASNVVSVAFQDANENFNGVVQHFNGFTGTATFDQKHTSSNASSTTCTSGATGTLANANSLVIGLGIHASTASAWSLGAGYSNLTQSNVGARSAAMESKVVAATTAVTATFSIAAARVNIGGVLVFYDVTGSPDVTINANVLSATFSLPSSSVVNTSPTVALNTPADSGSVSTTTPTLAFTGSDTQGDEQEYEVQVDTVNTFDSQSGTPSSLVAETSGAGTANSVTTSAIDTTGANLIIIGVSFNTGATPTISDNKGNTWTALTAQTIASNGSSQMYYCYNPTVGSGHTFTNSTTSGYSALSVMAFSGATSAPFDQQNGATTSVSSTLASGSVTPSQNNEIVVTHFMFNTAGTASVGSGFSTPTQQNFGSANNYGSAMAYKIQTTASAVNPTWTAGGGSTHNAATIATFKGGSAAAPLIDKKSETDTGFADVTNGADTHPFANGDQISYTVQAGDALTNGTTYYWRVRAKDPSGTGEYGAWATTRSFAVSLSGVDVTVSVSAPLTATFSIPSRTVTATRNVTVSPSVLAAAFSIPSYTAKTSVSVAPAVLSAVFSVQSATITTTQSVTVSPTALSAVFSTPSATPEADVVVAASVLSATFSVPSYSIATELNTDLETDYIVFEFGTTSITISLNNPLAATFSLPSATEETDTSIASSVLTATFSTQAPTITATENTTVSPAVLSATFSIPSYDVVTPDAYFAASVLTATFSIPSYTVTAVGNATISPAALSATFSIQTPTASTSVSIASSVLTATFSTQAPALTSDVSIAANVLTATFSVPAYTVTAVQNTSFSASVLTATFSVPSSSAYTDYTEAHAVLSATFSTQSVSVTTTQFVTISPSALSATFSIPPYAALAGTFVTPAVLELTFSIPTYDVTVTVGTDLQTDYILFGFDANAYPATVTAYFSLPSSAETIDVTVSPAVLSAVFSIPTFNAGAVTTVTPSVLSATFSIPTSATSVSVTAIPAALVATFSVQGLAITTTRTIVVTPDVLELMFSTPQSITRGDFWQTQYNESPDDGFWHENLGAGTFLWGANLSASSFTWGDNESPSAFTWNENLGSGGFSWGDNY